jgi:hypothetical protein
MLTTLTPSVSILNMIRNKSSYERFENNLISSKQASTQRLINKFNLDKNSHKRTLADVNENLATKVTAAGQVDTTNKMEQIKVLNYPVLTKKLDNRVSPIVNNPIQATTSNTNVNSSQQGVPKTSHKLHDDEIFNVYYNANDIKYQNLIVSASKQRSRTKSRNSQNNNNNNITMNEDSISSHSTFDFSVQLSGRKREDDLNITLPPYKNETKIVTVTHRLPTFKKKSSSNRSSRSDAPTLISEASTITLSEKKYPMINNLDESGASSQGPMSIQKIKKPDIFEMRSQNHILVKSTSNLSNSNGSLIDFSKNENRLVNNKYHYYLSNNEQNNLFNQAQKVSHLDAKRPNLQYLSEDSMTSIKTTSSSTIVQQPNLKNQKTYINMRQKRANTFFITEELHPEEILTNNRQPKRIDELSAENLKSNLDRISLKQIKTSLENNSSSINKSLNSILSKRNTYFRNDMLTQQQKAKLKAYQEKDSLTSNALVPQQNREIINKIYRAYNQNTKRFEGEPLDNLLNNDLKMPSINGVKNSAQNLTNSGILTNENKRAEKQKEFLEKIESVKENINSMHSISNYNQLIQKYKQANLKEIDKNMSASTENNASKIDNLLNKKPDGINHEFGAVPRKINVPYSSNVNLENEDKDSTINEFSLTKSPLLDHNFSERHPSGLHHSRKSPIGSDENFNTRKKFFQSMVRESSISEDPVSLIPEINEQIDALANSMSKKRVSFHENVIETDVESGNSTIKSIFN